MTTRSFRFLVVPLAVACSAEPSPTLTGGSSPSAGSTSTSTPSSAGSGPSTLPTGAPTTTTSPPPPTPAADLPPLFAEPVRHARAAPLAGGTLFVTSDGATAVAADPDRDHVFVVELATRVVRPVALSENDEPGRVVEGPPGRAYVALRRGGAVIGIDLASASVVQRMPVCNAPRGLAFDAALGRLHVACRSGRLVSLDAATGEIVSTLTLDDDLRDVALVNGSLVVTRFRSAEVLVLDALGQVVRRAAPAGVNGARSAVGFRMVAHPSGTVTVAHQFATDATLGTGLGAYYGGGCSTGGAVQQAVTTLSLDGQPIPGPANPSAPTAPVSTPPPRPDGLYASTVSVAGALGPIDLAFSRDGARIAMLASGNAWVVDQPFLTLFVATIDDPSGRVPPGFGPCGGKPGQGRYVPGEPVAVAFDANGRYVVQSREPALIALEGDIFIPLSTESRFDTGYAMFHMNAGSGISCASCHPEGGDDGHVWSFAEIGLRRSQSLEGGVGRRTPFHWSGDLATFDALFNEVMLERMSLRIVPPSASVAALGAWLDTIPALPPDDGLDADAVERGRALFENDVTACSSCHSGEEFADNLVHDVGTGGKFVTPSLRGVGFRTPLLHDGCAATLRARFGPCGGTAHGYTAGLTDPELDDLVTFMKSL